MDYWNLVFAVRSLAEGEGAKAPGWAAGGSAAMAAAKLPGLNAVFQRAICDD